MGTAVIGAPEFRARNGLIVKPCDNGGVEVGKPGYRDYTPPEASFALEEFFQAKRDAELGRWRWPENPQFVVYDLIENVVAVIDETNGTNATFSRGQYGGPSEYGDAARAYFEAHPDRKPWHDAEPGELWAINIGDDADASNWQGVVVSNEGRFLYRDGGSVALDQDFIIDGRRIWVKDAS